MIRQLSIECRPKEIPLTNHNRCKQRNESTGTRSKYTPPAESAGNACEQVTIGLGLTSDWLGKRRELCQPIIERGNAKQKQTRNYFRHSIENRSKPSCICKWGERVGAVSSALQSTLIVKPNQNEVSSLQ